MSSFDETIVCERYICDFTGHDICPGNVVGVGRSGKSEFEAKIVTKIRLGRIYFAGYLDKYEKVLDDNGEPLIFKKKTLNNQWYETYKKERKGYLLLHQHYSKLYKKNNVQEHITLVSEPLFAIHNPQIKGLLEMADRLKDQGLFPSDYKLGRTLVEFEEKEED